MAFMSYLFPAAKSKDAVAFSSSLKPSSNLTTLACSGYGGTLLSAGFLSKSRNRRTKAVMLSPRMRPKASNSLIVPPCRKSSRSPNDTSKSESRRAIPSGQSNRASSTSSNSCSASPLSCSNARRACSLAGRNSLVILTHLIKRLRVR